MDVRDTSAIFIASGSAVGLAISIHVEEIHPQSDFFSSPSTLDWIALAGFAKGCVNKVLFWRVDWVWDIGHVTNSQSCFPITPVDERVAIPWVVWIFTRPELNRHVVNVNPATPGCFPCNFVFAHFDDGVAKTRGWNAREIA